MSKKSQKLSWTFQPRLKIKYLNFIIKYLLQNLHSKLSKYIGPFMHKIFLSKILSGMEGENRGGEYLS
jgi:hypothetical protein